MQDVLNRYFCSNCKKTFIDFSTEKLTCCDKPDYKIQNFSKVSNKTLNYAGTAFDAIDEIDHEVATYTEHVETENAWKEIDTARRG